VFKLDGEYEQNEEKYKDLRKEILDDDDDDDDDGDDDSSDDGSGSDDGEDGSDAESGSDQGTQCLIFYHANSIFFFQGKYNKLNRYVVNGARRNIVDYTLTGNTWLGVTQKHNKYKLNIFR
jgi:hypothetical protein